MSLPTVFVCGVTGTKGGIIARNLLQAGAQVHAITRNSSSAEVQELQALGVKIFPGDFDDKPSIEAAMRGCTAAFLNFNFNFTDLGAELRRAKTLLTVAREAGVRNVVYSSGVTIDDPQRLSAWDPNGPVAKAVLSKQSIENEVAGAGFNFWTVLRPCSFMANFLEPKVSMYGALATTGVWKNAFLPSTVLPIVDTETIGKFGTAVFLDPAKFNGAKITIFDELLQPGQIIDKLSAAAGRDLSVEYMSDAEIEEKKGNPLVAGQLAIRDIAAFAGEIDEVKSWGVPLSSFDTFLERERAEVRHTYRQLI